MLTKLMSPIPQLGLARAQIVYVRNARADLRLWSAPELAFNRTLLRALPRALRRLTRSTGPLILAAP